MVTVEREATDENMCNSCLDREAPTYKLAVGNKIHATTLHLCADCLETLFNDCAEALNL
jgi:hypothetical protein